MEFPADHSAPIKDAPIGVTIGLERTFVPSRATSRSGGKRNGCFG